MVSFKISIRTVIFCTHQWHILQEYLDDVSTWAKGTGLLYHGSFSIQNRVVYWGMYLATAVTGHIHTPNVIIPVCSNMATSSYTRDDLHTQGTQIKYVLQTLLKLCFRANENVQNGDMWLEVNKGSVLIFGYHIRSKLCLETACQYHLAQNWAHYMWILYLYPLQVSCKDIFFTYM